MPAAAGRDGRKRDGITCHLPSLLRTAQRITPTWMHYDKSNSPICTCQIVAVDTRLCDGIRLNLHTLPPHTLTLPPPPHLDA